MALPAHLAKYHGLIDLIVDQLVREIENGVDTKKAASDELAAHDNHDSGSEVKSYAKNKPAPTRMPAV